MLLLSMNHIVHPEVDFSRTFVPESFEHLLLEVLDCNLKETKLELTPEIRKVEADMVLHFIENKN